MAIDRHQKASRYGAHPPTCSCESCVARRLGKPDPKELRKLAAELKEEPQFDLAWLKQADIGD